MRQTGGGHLGSLGLIVLCLLLSLTAAEAQTGAASPAQVPTKKPGG
jgi:hypothetical protein